MNSVLIVDDVVLNIRMLRDILEGIYEIKTAESGEEALGILKEYTPDIMLLDYTMKGMSGIDVLNVMKKDPVLKRIPVICMSSNEDEGTEVDSLKHGSVDFIQRPFKAYSVKQRLKTQIDLAMYRKNLSEAVQERTEQIQETEDAFIGCLAEFLERKSSEDLPNRHLKRMELYAAVFIEELSLEPAYGEVVNDLFLKNFLKALPLHDVGRTGIQDLVFLERDSLEEEEVEQLTRSLQTGSRALDRLEEITLTKSYIRMARNMALNYYESFDGFGYPQGVKGEAIPLEARILILLEAYDLLRARRSYKQPQSHEEACQFIYDEAGRMFDPKLVEIFRGMNIKLDDIVLDYADQGWVL